MSAAVTQTVLVVDGDVLSRESIDRVLNRAGYSAVLVNDGLAALEYLREGRVDLVVSELRITGLSGFELLHAVNALAPNTGVIFLTRFGTIEGAVRAVKAGAYDFLTKPVDHAKLLPVVRSALERGELIRQPHALERGLDALLLRVGMIGTSPAFCRMMALVEQVADSSAAILIRGERGAGKQLVARAIHTRSARHDRPFVVVSCSGKPDSTLEAELFGCEVGAISGAGRKAGRFESADAGILFLDEVADLSLVTQPKILRVFQEGEFERLGGTKTIRVDVRIVAATTQDLSKLVREKRFRGDLYYRLNVITVTVPPLRERREDIRLLAEHFLRVYAAKNNRKLEGFTDEAVRRLEAYAWPGNVRELENVIERGVVLARGSLMDLSELPEEVAGAAPLREGVLSVRIGTPLAEVEQRLLEATLRATNGNKTLTARLLGVDPRTVSRKLERTEKRLDMASDQKSARRQAQAASRRLQRSLVLRRILGARRRRSSN